MIQFYSPKINNRIKYAADLILRQVCLFDYKIITKIEELDQNLPIINYTGSTIEHSFVIQPYGLLYEKRIQEFGIEAEYGGEEKVRFFKTGYGDLDFDIFSAAFFLATRMEEYWKFEPDQHGRFSAKNSVSKKLGFLHLPLINIWGKILQQKLKAKFPEIKINEHPFEIINTIDIDNAWAYKHKPLLIQIGGVSKHFFKGDFKSVKDRFSTLLGKQSDPYDTYEYINNISKQNQIKSIYFFLLGDRNKFDKNLNWKNKALQQLILKLKNDTQSEIGLHPSYQSYLDSNQLIEEVKRIEKITGKEINLARKHFLKLSIPDTYRNYENAGLTHDYTMGYADEIGFRASICTPYTFFDLLLDKELNVTIHPFAYMDGTLNEYMKLDTQDAIQKIQQLKKYVQGVGGTFIGVWHNETLNDSGIWRGWRSVFENALINSFSQTT